MTGEPAPSLDLAAFFGLTEEEAHSLGLDPERPSALTAVPPATRPDGAAGGPRHAQTPPAADAPAPETLAQRQGALPVPTEQTLPPTADSSHPSMAQDLLAVFMEEAIELLDSLHTALESVERAEDASGVIEARRAFHTIKGGARVCGLRALADLAHACEDVMGAVPARASLPPGHVAMLFEAEQELRAGLARPAEGPGSDASADALCRRLRAHSARQARPSDAGAQISVPVPPPGTAGTPRGQEAAPQRDAAPSPVRRPAAHSAGAQGHRISVDRQKIEDIVAKVTEIVANRAAAHALMETMSATVMDSVRAVQRLQAIATHLHYQIVTQGLDAGMEPDTTGLALETYGPVRQLLLQLQEAVGDQQALTQAVMDLVTNRRALAAVETRLDTELQGALLNMRLMPVSQLRVRLDQVVRSAASAAARDVRWTMEGQHVALDKQVCDRLFEPLMHVLRNAIDHGIEPPEERVRLGKPRAGRIVVRAHVEGNQATVSVSDDGRGMDPERIARSAMARGVVTPEEASRLSSREALELIFRPGFSTAGAVTDLSGRGMGMAIVRETCTRLGGSVSISPRAGGGTEVTLRVPLSTAVVHALIVRDNGRVMAIPASQVLSVHLVREVAVATHDAGLAVRIGREEMPLHRLPRGGPRPQGVQAASDGEFSAMVLSHRGGRVALAVDELVSEEDLIVKPLPILLQGLDRLLGAVILPDGTPAPVLNLPPLLEYHVPHGAVEAPDSAALRPERTVLVVDDSLTMRVALARTLKHAGYAVLAARDGLEALDLIREHGLPELITLDLEMPRMDGLETLYAIRQMPGAQRTPIFILTSRAGQKHQRTAMNLGATRYFTKPYHDREFVRAVREATLAPA